MTAPIMPAATKPAWDRHDTDESAMSATTAMIVSCPSCATTYELPPGERPADGAVIRCSHCGHSWLEGTAREAAPGRRGPNGRTGHGQARPLHRRPGLVPVGPVREAGAGGPAAGGDDTLGLGAPGLEDEAAVLAKEALARELARKKRLREKRRERLRWAALVAFLAVVAGGVHAFRNTLAPHFPGLAKVYARAGMELNPIGFEVASVTAERATTLGGDRVLTVEGTLENVTGKARKAPGLRFVLRDASGGALHAWELKAVSAKEAPAGRPLQFVTRLADPPKEAVRVDVMLLPRS